MCFLFKEGLAFEKASGRENKHTKWWKLVFKDMFHQLSAHSHERSVWQPISCMLSVTGSSSTLTPLASVANCWSLAGPAALNWQGDYTGCSSQWQHMPCPLPRKPHSSSEQCRFWSQESWTDRILGCWALPAGQVSPSSPLPFHLRL